MATKSLNSSLHAAKNSKKDEFYTQLADIEKELRHYKEHFKGKVVLCNCDDPRVSNFFEYFSKNFEELGLKQLITTCYKNQNRDLFSQHTDEKAIYAIPAATLLFSRTALGMLVAWRSSSWEFRAENYWKTLVCLTPIPRIL